MIVDNHAISIVDLLNDYSIEVNPRDATTIDSIPDRVDPYSEVYLTWIPGSDPMDMVAPAAKLRRSNLCAVPHIGARHIESSEQLEDLINKLTSSAGVERVLIVGGDRRRAAGPYNSALEIIQTGVLQRFGIMHIAIAGFPEGNPSISTENLTRSLIAKVRFSRDEGLHVTIVTQFCFSAEPIVHWLRFIKSMDIDVPVRIGLAGPAGLGTLTRYAIRCGVGNSLRVLTEKPSFAKLLTQHGPADIIRDIATSIGSASSLNPLAVGFHFFLFGGFERTMDWIGIERGR